MTSCDAEDDCQSADKPVLHYAGESDADRAHTFGTVHYYLEFHPECCPRQVMGDVCPQTHPDKGEPDA